MPLQSRVAAKAGLTEHATLSFVMRHPYRSIARLKGFGECPVSSVEKTRNVVGFARLQKSLGLAKISLSLMSKN